MIRSVVRFIYRFFPFAIKIFIKDLFFYTLSSLNKGVSIKSIKFEKSFDKVAVLGNGPSLKKDKCVIKDLILTHDFVCVNNFCDDELYSVIKPKLYIFLDGYFFSENAHPDWVKRREKTFKELNVKTSWPMKIVLPHGADEKILLKSIKNENIEIVKINTQSLFRNDYSKLVGLVFDSGFYGPPQINVLIYGIYLSIIAGYDEIFVYGADLSFHKDVDVNQKDNDLYITFRHFNEQDKMEILRKNPSKIEKWKMAELLQLSADTFYAHDVMFKYAKTKNVKIYNASSYSLIDAYPRLMRKQ